MTDGLIADINPIGGISKTDLKRFIAYARDAFSLPVLDKSVAIKTMMRLVSLQIQIPERNSYCRAGAYHGDLCPG
jgi:hypothetical protein